jgi:hypothetical protein
MKKIVVITWVDSSAHSLGWTDETDLELVPIITVGFLLKEDKDSYTISHSLGFSGLHFDAFVIPKGCVKSFIEMEDSSVSEKQAKGKSTRVLSSTPSGEIRLKG